MESIRLNYLHPDNYRQKREFDPSRILIKSFLCDGHSIFYRVCHEKHTLNVKTLQERYQVMFNFEAIY